MQSISNTIPRTLRVIPSFITTPRFEFHRISFAFFIATILPGKPSFLAIFFGVLDLNGLALTCYTANAADFSGNIFHSKDVELD